MRRAYQVSIITITALTWLCVAYITGLPKTWWGATKPFLSAISVAATMVFIYDKFAWKWSFFHGIITQQPNLSGVWKVQLNSTWVNPKTDLQTDPIYGYAQIDQTASTFSIRIYTVKSHSLSKAYSFRLEQSVYVLSVVYENRPNMNEREKGSPLHLGAVTYNIRGMNPKAFQGEYWTERKTTGTIILSEKRIGEINSFNEGCQIYSPL